LREDGLSKIKSCRALPFQLAGPPLKLPLMTDTASMVQLTRAQWRLVAEGFRGPRPGSNALPMLGLTDGGVTVTGAEIDALWRAGMLAVRPVHGGVEVMPASVGPQGEVPEVEMTHNYELSEEGRRRALAAMGGVSA
jgi:hypothetical protein